MVTAILQRIDRRLLALLVVVGIAAVLVNVLRSPAETRTVSAHFDRAVSVYKGTDVRVLGVTIGKVTAVVPEGNSVLVEMEYDASYKLPKDARAVIVTPTLVADRFVQLTPVYRDGPVMADGADIPLQETGVPVELDRIYGSLQALTRALGPNGVNADGTLDAFLANSRKALEGQGAQGNQMIRDLATAAETFGEGAGPLFETVTSLAEFTDALAKNDDLVRAFMTDLTGVSRTLAKESDELTAAVAAVARAVGSVKGFVRTNRDALVTDVRKLTEVLTTIVSEKDNLEKAVKIAPTAMANLNMSFDHYSGSQNSRVNVAGYVWDADGLICSILMQNPAMPELLKKTACDLIERLLEPILTKFPAIPPEYKSYLPRQKQALADTEKGIEVPAPTLVAYSTEENPSVRSLLGGAP